MTPKEKAEELCYNFSRCKDESNRYFVIPIVGDAKQCVLIAINELIKETGSKYWYDVKLEINKL